MKKLITLTLFIFSVITIAQDNEKKNFSPEQKATLITKRMTLHLDLTDKQEKEVYKLYFNKIKNKTLAKSEKERVLSTEERFQKKLNRLDQQIAFKKEMKNILSEVQYEKFEKTQFHRKKKRKRTSLKRHKLHKEHN